MKKLDWKRIGWTVVLILGWLFAFPCALSLNRAFIEKTVYFNWNDLVLASVVLVGIILFVLLIHIHELKPQFIEIFRFYYHNGEEEK